ncbi:MAG: hypothetical protein Q9201_001843 [Fulgogasparrea decipioides]
MAAASMPQAGQTLEKLFPFRELSLGLRRMVYREDSTTESFVTQFAAQDIPSTEPLDTEVMDDNLSAKYSISGRPVKAASTTGSNPENLLFVDKQISAEATDILYYERFLNVEVGPTMSIHGVRIY